MLLTNDCGSAYVDVVQEKDPRRLMAVISNKVKSRINGANTRIRRMLNKASCSFNTKLIESKTNTLN